MVNVFDDQLWNDVASRVEQSRSSYNIQAEQFRSLNTNFQTYLIDTKQIDDDNNRLQNSIEEIRTNYIQTLENHLKRLPEDFRQESLVLTDAHLQRYKSKTRAKRFINEREEIKKRINFVVNNEKEQLKRLNQLQRQDRAVQNELKCINEQLQSALNHVEREKQIHRQATEKIDQLQMQLEQVYVERSKTEFEVQSLREEVKLMQTAKEFLDEEYETILEAQTDANLYLLSCLNESILRIHADFEHLNNQQIEQIENEYKQTIKKLEETSLANVTGNEIEIAQQHTSQTECGKLEEEYRSANEELSKLHEHNRLLSDRISSMEMDLRAIRNTHLRESNDKDNELQRSKIALEALNEQLTRLTEYDRNLQFELTLYRGVLESEYRRKQQQLANDQQPHRPTVLRTTLARAHKTYPILPYLNQTELNEEKNDVPSTESALSTIYVEDDQIKNTENLSRVSEKSPDDNQQTNTPKTPQQSPSEVQTVVTHSEDLPNASSSPSTSEGNSLFETITYLTSSLLEKEEDLTNNNDVQIASTEHDDESPLQTEQSALTTLEDKQVPETYQEHFTDSDILENQQESKEVLQPVLIDSEEHESWIKSQDKPMSPVKEEANYLEALSSSLKQLVKSFESDQIPDKEAKPNDEKVVTSPTNFSSLIQSDEQQNSAMSPIESTTLEKQTLSDVSENQHFSTSNHQATEETSVICTDERYPSNSIGDLGNENHLAESSDGYDNDFESEEKTKSSFSYETDDAEQDPSRPSIYRIEELETDPSDKEESSSFDVSKAHRFLNSSGKNDAKLEEDPITTEEPVSSSDYNQIEENSDIGFISSSGYYGTANDSTHLQNQELKRTDSSEASLTDVCDDNVEPLEEADRSTSPKLEDRESNENSLEAVMEDLRYVYRDLANEDDLVEIDDNFSEQLIDRLEFGDNIIRTLFDNFVTKYIIQPAATGTRSKTLDWTEFRDVLFPIVTSRYTERHIRKLFDLFDTSKDGFLSFEEIIDLFELLQVNNSAELAHYMMNEFGKNRDDQLSIDEFVAIVKKTDDINNSILPEKLEAKHWFSIHPNADENQSISLPVPIVNFPSKTNVSNTEMLNNHMILLARIFKRVGADAENKQLDSKKSTLAMKLTNEFINNNILISNEDLHSFIDLYLNQKQNSDCYVTWEEFRDIFLPIVNSGIVTKEDLSRWFNIFDCNHRRKIDKEQILQLLRLLQFSDPEKILNKMNAISETYTNNEDSFTPDEFLFAFDNTDESTSRLCLANEQAKSYDLDWLTKTVF
ncbi:unnamed protein product [Adineta ricciae]|uniref:EF-hand domain-containing protein n=1 Tax=Adineta ricciae TaxID=249248 RepID=A0A814NHT0_ADIRI|nr:unnamed protein product [Adineta ricciae]CAF1092122.1 unnamed protein product [Adineta ricciae]